LSRRTLADGEGAIGEAENGEGWLISAERSGRVAGALGQWNHWRHWRQWSWWAVAAGVALLSASQWLHASSVEYLAALIVATAASLSALRLGHGRNRWWALACALSLAVFAALAVPAEWSLHEVRRDWERWRGATAARGLVALRVEIDRAITDNATLARRALAVPHDRARAFAELASLVNDRPTSDEFGIVVYRAGAPYAWAGMIRPPIDPSRSGTTVIGTTFYLALQTAERQGDVEAVSVILLDAEPPADSLSAPLSTRVARSAGLSDFVFGPPTDSLSGPQLLHYASGGVPLFDVRAAPLVQGEVAQRIAETVRVRAGLALLIALGCFIIGVWREARTFAQRVAALGVGLVCTALVPLNEYSNLTRLFSPVVYFTPGGGPFTDNAGALAATSALVLLGILAVLRRPPRRLPWWTSVIAIVLVAGLGPFLLRDLARGIQMPLYGVDVPLWLTWEVPLFLAAVSVLLIGAGAGAMALGRQRGLAPYLAPGLATVAAVLAPVVWHAPGQWPWWYTLLWTAAIAMLALSRQSRNVVLSAATVAALGATTLVWGRTARGRVELAERDLASLSQVDSDAVSLLRRFGTRLAVDSAPESREALLENFVTSDLSSAGYPASLAAWPTDSGPTARLATANIPEPRAAEARLVARARATGVVLIEPVPTDTVVDLVMAAPAASGGVTCVTLAPRSRLFQPDPFVALLGIEAGMNAEPPYTVRLRGIVPAPPDSATGRAVWRREGSELHGDWLVRTGTAGAPVHVEVELQSPYALVQRGALVVLLDLAAVGLLWLASVVADGGAGRWLRARRRRWTRSYRARLSLALFAFFVIPAVAFAVWAYGELASDATQSRSVLVQASLRGVASPATEPGDWLAAESERVAVPLFLYRGGELAGVSDTLYGDIAPIGRFLAPEVEQTLAVRNEDFDSRLRHVGGQTLLFGYRALSEAHPGSAVLAAPARADEAALGRRRRDLGVLVLFTTAAGALAAFWLSGLAARELARPIRTLRQAALAIAGGTRTPPLGAEPTVEFSPVFAAFRRMASDLSASRDALEEAQRRTVAVLRTVASGVVAVDPDARVSLANPRAEALFGVPLPAGTPLAAVAPAALAAAVERFIKSGRPEEDVELSADGRQLRGALTRLSRGGAVVTVDDVTELARAQRVLAWGEMARQVAHEIKNPLTPIRLGVQHLRRARADARVDFDRVLEQNVNQILAEIDRLDEIARAFSRYGAAPGERAAAASIDVAAVVREVVSLERMGEETALRWDETGVDAPIYAMARADELKEVLLNLLENARHAGATRVAVHVERLDGGDPLGVAITVRDDGQGIAAAVLPRVFEPHFSTRTSGSGLGLAISRQLVERWGGEITLESAPGVGTTVRMALQAGNAGGLA
jgi:signal transduction histidine kinase